MCDYSEANTTSASSYSQDCFGGKNRVGKYNYAGRRTITNLIIFMTKKKSSTEM